MADILVGPLCSVPVASRLDKRRFPGKTSAKAAVTENERRTTFAQPAQLVRAASGLGYVGTAPGLALTHKHPALYGRYCASRTCRGRTRSVLEHKPLPVRILLRRRPLARGATKQQPSTEHAHIPLSEFCSLPPRPPSLAEATLGHIPVHMLAMQEARNRPQPQGKQGPSHQAADAQINKAPIRRAQLLLQATSPLAACLCKAGAALSPARRPRHRPATQSSFQGLASSKVADSSSKGFDTSWLQK